MYQVSESGSKWAVGKRRMVISFASMTLVEGGKIRKLKWTEDGLCVYSTIAGEWYPIFGKEQQEDINKAYCEWVLEQELLTGDR